MKKVLIVSDHYIRSSRKREILTAQRFLNENTNTEWEFTFKRLRGFLGDIEIEDGDNLDEHSIKARVDAPEYDYVHVDMQRVDWYELGLRKTLYGQAEVIDGQGITYGRWTESTADRVKYLDDEYQYLTEVGLGIIHEIGHCVTYQYNYPYNAHTHFYGYETNQPRSDKSSLERWVRTPDPETMFKAVDFDAAPGDTISPPATVSDVVTPVEAEYWSRVTQGFLHEDDFTRSAYALTGMHIGVDFGCPMGTPLRMPIDGEIFAVRDYTYAGKTIIILFEKDGQKYAARFSHLTTALQPGTYKAGALIGLTGNSGQLTTGAHLHVDCWKGWSITAHLNHLKAMQQNGSSLAQRQAYIKEWLVNPLELFGTVETPIVVPPVSTEVTLKGATDEQLLAELSNRLK